RFHQRQGLAPGLLQPRRPKLTPAVGPVGRLHARRAVDQNHMPRALDRIGHDLRLGDGKDRRRQHQQLQQQQNVPPQPLKRRIGLQILDRLLPQQRRRDLHLPPPQLQKVQNQQRRNRNRGNDAGEQWGAPG